MFEVKSIYLAYLSNKWKERPFLKWTLDGFLGNLKITFLSLKRFVRSLSCAEMYWISDTFNNKFEQMQVFKFFWKNLKRHTASFGSYCNQMLAWRLFSDFYDKKLIQTHNKFSRFAKKNTGLRSKQTKYFYANGSSFLIFVNNPYFNKMKF